MKTNKEIQNTMESISKWIFAAGGIVSRHTPHGPEVAVIHRSRYGDWCLPKGKPKEGESLVEAAIREVKEETGCDVHITSFAGCTYYKSKGTPKIVLFWNMTPDGECSFKTSEEVCEIFWFTPRKAINKLDYPEEKALLTKEFFNKKSYFFSRFFSRFRFRQFLPKSKRYHRLSSSLQVYSLELERRIKQLQNIDQSWVEIARKLLLRVDTALYKNNVEEGWKLFKAAHRMEIFGFEEDELEARAEALQIESVEKLISWRQKAVDAILKKINEILKKDNKTSKDIKIIRNHLYEATLICDEHFNNQYFKIRFLRSQMIALYVVLFLIISKILSTDYKKIFLQDNDNIPAPSREIVASVVFFGLLGGTLSSIVSTISTSNSTRTPQRISDYLSTLMHPVVGAASAIAIYFFLVSEIVNIGDLTVAKILVFSFVAGFSERLLTKVIESLVGKEESAVGKEG